MKKEYLIGLITGCLLTASALMFLGAADNDSQNGKYQMTTGGSPKGGLVIRMIDTSNGQQYNFSILTKKWKKFGNPIED